MNKKTGTISGRIGGNVYCDVNGIQVIKSMPREHLCYNSPLVIRAKAIMSELPNIWRELPAEVRAIWEEYAAEQGSASDVESSQVVSHKHCPIPNYPPRPKKISGYLAFVGSNALGIHCGFGVRLYPPLDVRVPPAPMLECKYERTSGELLVWLDTPAISKPKERSLYKAIIWLTANRNEGQKARYIARRRKFDLFDVAPIAQRLERRYTGVEHTQEGFDYKPVMLKDVPYLRIHIGAQLVMAPNELTAPLVSSGNWVSYWLLNEQRYVQLEDLIQADYLRSVGILKYVGDEYLACLAAKQQALAKNEFVLVK
ncbi:hypothetical protein HY605_04025 [Candidatus Peregrinibacteria bacterium]|nr:hypothetical protein [Candidatus Peregrinibacteria bacterium]